MDIGPRIFELRLQRVAQREAIGIAAEAESFLAVVTGDAGRESADEMFARLEPHFAAALDAIDREPEALGTANIARMEIDIARLLIFQNGNHSAGHAGRVAGFDHARVVLLGWLNAEVESFGLDHAGAHEALEEHRRAAEERHVTRVQVFPGASFRLEELDGRGEAAAVFQPRIVPLAPLHLDARLGGVGNPLRQVGRHPGAIGPEEGLAIQLQLSQCSGLLRDDVEGADAKIFRDDGDSVFGIRFEVLRHIKLIILVMLRPGAAGTIGHPGIIDGEPIPAIGGDVEHRFLKSGEGRLLGQENGLVIAAISGDLPLCALGQPNPLG